MSLETLTKLASTTVGSGGASSIVFSGIPQNYTDLCIKLSSRSNRAADEDGLGVKLNSLTDGYTYTVLVGDGSNPGSIYTAYGQLWTCRIQGDSPTAGIFSSTNLYFNNYSDNNPKTITAESVTEKNGTNGYLSIASVINSYTSPVTSITLSALNGSFMQFTKATLYGIKNARQTAGNSVKATGGSVVFDGTYVYHVFSSTGAFVPTQPMTADVLVVAGGGGGGYYYAGAGGAGGVCYQARRSLAASSHTVTVGAGGAHPGTTFAFGANGSNSYFSNIEALGGGGGGFWDNTGRNGQTGGSGGGGSMGTSSGNTTSGGAATQSNSNGATGYGNAGGNGLRSGSFFGGGGGGGAGAAGTSATGTQAGPGGAGLNTWASWEPLTRNGFNGYIAGGGGSGAEAGTSGIGGLGGGGNGGNWNSSTAPTAGAAGTGGGGGSGGGQLQSASGGSGIVIVRYKA